MATPEKKQHLEGRKTTHTTVPHADCIHQLFSEQSRRKPDAVAVVSEDTLLSYGELEQRSNQLGHYLKNRGIGPEVRVGICLERSVDMLVAILGVLKAGGAYVPIDPELPHNRVLTITQDAQPALILTQECWLDKLSRSTFSTICLTLHEATIAQEKTTPPDASFAPHHIAYVFYTSGSTGTPKGVMVTHKSVVLLLHSFEAIAPSKEPLRGGSVCPFGFDVSVWEFFSVLCFGGALHILPQTTAIDIYKLSNYLTHHAITNMYIPPAFLDSIADHFETERKELPLDRLLVGVEPILQKTLQRFRDLSPTLALVNGYGPTETTICATFFSFQRATQLDQRTPIGRAVPGNEVYIVDSSLRKVLDGEVGEIVVGGTGLARGYLNDPALTGEKFIPHPFTHLPGARLYRTGDLGRYLPDGSLEFVDRVDHQVKLRGFRIELNEIELALMSHPSVQKAAVIVNHEDGIGDHLAAYILLRQGEQTSSQELRNFLADILPQYMVPSTFVMLNHFPLTSSGKVDRKALATRPQTATMPMRSYRPSRTASEELLRNIWVEVLGTEDIGPFDNFFELGGHSLLANKIVARIRNVFKLDISIELFFKAPTIAELAQILDENYTQNLSKSTALPMQPIARDKPLPLSFPQEHIWFLQQLDRTNMAYNFQASLRFTGTLNVAVLEQCLQALVMRHEIFRTTFEERNGQPFQIVHPQLHITLPQVTICADTPAESERLIQQQITDELKKPFDLTKLPLIRWLLLQVNEEEHILIHVEHHIVHDGWSFNIFVRELIELYTAFVEGKPSPLPELPIQFADFAYWQRQWLQGDQLNSHLQYWQAKLRNLTRLDLPTDHPRPAIQTFRGNALRTHLSADLYNSLKAFSHAEGVTLFMTMFAGFLVLLYRYTMQEDICTGSGVANRRWQETEGLIGMLVNTIVLRTDLSGDPTFKELVHRVRAVTLEAYAHQDVPFNKIVEAVNPERSRAYNPLFQVMFAFHDSPLPKIELPHLSLSLTEGLSNQSAKFDLNVIVLPRAEQRVGLTTEVEAEEIVLVWEYNTDLFDTSTMQRMLQQYQTLLENITRNAQTRLSELPLLTQDELHQLLVAWNTTQVEYPAHMSVAQIFEQQAEYTPDTIAVVYQDHAYTYQELNQQANRLGHLLRRWGVGPDVLVGVCMERCLEMLVALLGVLKAGGAYLPLDPTYPTERLTYMLQDAHVNVVLTQQRFSGVLPSQQGQTFWLDTHWHTLTLERHDNLPPLVLGNHLAYIIYTSGSTGRPKGVMNRHSSLVNLCFGLQEFFAASTVEHISLVTSINFDISVNQIFPTLVFGKTLHIIPDEVKIDPRAFLTYITHRRLHLIDCVPSYLHALLNEQTAEEITHDLQYILVGGEKLEKTLLHKVFSRLGSAPTVVNIYGLTEVADISSFAKICYKDCDTPVTVGYPLQNTKIYIIDPHYNPQPIGLIGEICLTGEGLSRGYINKPALTAEKFVPNPFGRGERFYKTGDLGRRRTDGTIEVLGRSDQQVKIRGFRIEIGEIETTLRQHPDVQEAVVDLQQDPQREMCLVAYVVTNQPPSPLTQQLRHFLQQYLPPYMIPSSFISLESLPLTPNGKIDRRALPAPSWTTDSSSHVLSAEPRSPLEAALLSQWKATLGRANLSIHDHFFEVGGHSLKAVELVSRIQRELDLEVPLSLLFEASTVAELATALSEISPKSTSPLPTGIVRIRKGSPQICPLFLLPGIGGYVMYLWHLGTAFPPQQPTYAIQGAGLDHETPFFSRLEEMAAYYLYNVRQVQPQGPYYFVGKSSGGIIALEMARQLEQEAEQAYVGLLDTSLPQFLNEVHINLREAIRIVFAGLSKQRLDFAIQIPEEEVIPYYYKLGIQTGILPHTWQQQDLRYYIEFIISQHRMFQLYAQHPVCIEAPLYLFTAQQETNEGAGRQLDKWGNYTKGGLQKVSVPGHHDSITEPPNVEHLARAITAQFGLQHNMSC